MADTTNFLANTAGHGESEATPIAGGDANKQPGPWGEVHLHRGHKIPMMDVGPCRLDLSTAAFSTLQPPSVGQDWEPPRLPSNPLESIFSTHTMEHQHIQKLPRTVGAPHEGVCQSAGQLHHRGVCLQGGGGDS